MVTAIMRWWRFAAAQGDLELSRPPASALMMGGHSDFRIGGRGVEVVKEHAYEIGFYLPEVEQGASGPNCQAQSRISGPGQGTEGTYAFGPPDYGARQTSIKEPLTALDGVLTPLKKQFAYHEAATAPRGAGKPVTPLEVRVRTVPPR